jgi:hypothetical protein
VSTNRSTNRGAPRVNAAGAGFVVVLFVVVFHDRGYRSHRAVIEVAIAVFEIAVIAFVVFTAVVVIISEIVLSAVGCIYSSCLFDGDRSEWKNGVSMLRKVTGIYTQI